MSGDRELRPGPLRRWRHAGRAVLVEYDGPVLSVTHLADGIARIRLAPTGAFAPRRPWSATPPDDAFDPVPVTVDADADGVRVSSGRLTVHAARAGARVTVRDRDGTVLLTDGPDGGPAWRAGGGATWTRHMPRDENYVGFGERTGLLDQRGRRLTCWCTDRYEFQGPGVDELYQAIPCYLAVAASGRCHGVYLHNTYRSAMDLTAERDQRLVMSVDGGELDWYVLAGPDPADVVGRFTALTGRMPLPPRWALGYQQARWGYASADRIRSVAADLRRHGVPADVLYLDIDHQDRYRTFTWDPERFPDPAGLAAELGAEGFKLAAVVDVGVSREPDAGYDVFDEGHRKGYFLTEGGDLLLRHVWPGLCAFPDFASAAVRQWWGGWYATLLDRGMRGVVNDMNEPAMHDLPMDHPDSGRVEPPPDTPHDEDATHAEVHNVYALLENAATDAALLQARPDERILRLTRAGGAGIQRYAAVWTGDNGSHWEHLEMSLPQLMNLGLSGVAFAGADIGGFFGDCGPELLARWFQLGCCYPLARNHCARGHADQEPWVWGPEILDACRAAVRQRYRLLPHLYTLLADAAQTGAPVLRPLLYHYPADPLARLRADQALLGRDLMVAPVLRPGVTARAVYFPAGTWHDTRSGEVHAGGRAALVSAVLTEGLPLFARGGGVIASGPVGQHTDELPLDPLTLDIYPDKSGRADGELYEDDGTSLAYTRGAWARTRYAYRDGTLTARRSGRFAVPPRRVEIRLHDPDGTRHTHLREATTDWTVTP
ncbi:glycoside hydrolase family 31 protein [Luedemannella flava]|uniref:Glycoside hydrolase family 31 protein n=1 Tax=Luedemannella flava TaxID=349316 RepID=A0ABN2LB94_9ACTN